MGCASSKPESRTFDDIGGVTITKSAEQPLGVLLITNNVSGVFDDVWTRLPLWVQAIGATIESHRADFIAIHLQEIGGTDWKRKGLDHVRPYVQAVLDAFPEFWCSGFLCDMNATETFTALGSIYLVRKSAAHLVLLWQFNDSDGGDGIFRPVASLSSPLVAEPQADVRFCRLAQFPAHMFEKGKLSRKGYMLTRWRLAERATLDLINIHNMHDGSNVGAVQRVEGKAESEYAQRRRSALEHTMRTQVALASTVQPPPACFVFGDFNFRLNMASVVESLCGPQELKRAQAMADAKAEEPLELVTAAGTGEVAIEFAPKRFLLRQPDQAMEPAFRAHCQEVRPAGLCPTRPPGERAAVAHSLGGCPLCVTRASVSGARSMVPTTRSRSPRDPPSVPAVLPHSHPLVRISRVRTHRAISAVRVCRYSITLTAARLS